MLVNQSQYFGKIIQLLMYNEAKSNSTLQRKLLEILILEAQH